MPKYIGFSDELHRTLEARANALNMDVLGYVRQALSVFNALVEEEERGGSIVSRRAGGEEFGLALLWPDFESQEVPS